MPKLLYLVTEDWYFVSHRLPLARAARDAGYDVTIITGCGQHCQRMTEEGFHVLPFRMNRRGLNPLELAREVLGVARLYRQVRPDIAHHVALRPVVVGGLAARVAGVPRVVSAIAGMGFVFTGSRGGVARRVLKALLRLVLQSGVIVVQNPDDADIVTRLGVDSGRRHLIAGAGVDTRRFAPTPDPEGEPVVLMASRLLRDKGVGEFVEAAQFLKGRAKFVLVGGPDLGNPASVEKSEVDEWVRQGVVEWWGHHDEMERIYSSAHVVCLPSYREGLPKVLLEAMASGRPCITTDAPGCRDAVRHEDNGLLVPVGDAEALKAAIERLLDNWELRRKLGSRGRERAVREFSLDSVIGRTLAVYSDLWLA